MRLFGQKVERQRFVKGRDRGVPVAGRRLAIRQVQLDGERQLMEPRPLLREPLLEGGLAEIEPVEERPAIEPCRPPQVRQCVSGAKPLKPGDVHLGDVRPERDRLALGNKDRRSVVERPANGRERLAQAVPGLRSPRSPQSSAARRSRGCGSPARQARKATSASAFRVGSFNASPSGLCAAKPPRREMRMDAIGVSRKEQNSPPSPAVVLLIPSQAPKLARRLWRERFAHVSKRREIVSCRPARISAGCSRSVA